jgi:hypothetical protein
MNTISGIQAIELCREVSKLPDGSFNVYFYQYSRAKREASAKLKGYEGCKIRSMLPQDKFQVDGDNYFLFTSKEGDPKMCYRILLRFIAFPPDFQLRKINWLT